jgi:hypothetical protein
MSLSTNVLHNAVFGNDNSLVGVMIGAVTLVAVIAGVRRLTALVSRRRDSPQLVLRRDAQSRNKRATK